MLVPVSINDAEPAEFILDTGASISLLTPELAARLGIAPTATREARGAAGTVTVALASVKSLALGQARLEDVPVAITDDLHRIGAAVGAAINGDIGYNVLKHFRLRIDYARSRLHLSRREPGAIDPGGVRFTLAHPEKPLVLVPARVNGRGPFQFALDTGASRTVIAPDLARSLGITSVADDPLTAGGGRVASSLGWVDVLAVGTARVEHLTVAVADFLVMLSDAIGTRLDGIVGYNFLREFTVTIDYPAETLWLE